MTTRPLALMLLTAAALLVTAGARAAVTADRPSSISHLPSSIERIPRDTTRYGEDDELDMDGLFAADTTRKPVNMVVGGHNIVHDVLESRYLPGGDTFRKGKAITRNMFLQLGVGGEKIIPPTESFEFGVMPQIQFGAGKTFGKLSTVRLLGHAAQGYLNTHDLKLSKYGLKADYMYDLSGYFDGFSPTRQLNLSAVVGAGVQYSKLEDESSVSGEAHMGLQLRFYTGPQGYISLEPYIGIGTDQMDVSRKMNWRSTDLFYGVNLNYIYYLHSNLSPEAWKSLVLRADSSHYDQVSKDYHVESWQQPWFVQFANGLTFMKSPVLGMGQTMGSEISLQGGKWLSPVIGVRATLYQRADVWRKVSTAAVERTFHPQYDLDRHNVYMGVRLEAMANPLGFLKNFHWDSPWGFYLVGGYERGWLKKQQSEPLSCSSFGWGGGVNLWYQPEPGLKFFVEPRFMHNEYSIPYTNVDWSKRYVDNNVTVNVGFTVEKRDDKRFYSHSYENEYVTDRLRPWAVGGAFGLNFIQTEGGYTGGTGLSYNGQLFGEYHLDRLKGVRLGIEFVNLRRDNLTRFTDYNMSPTHASEGYSPVEREGLWTHQYGLLLVSPGALVDLNHLMMHYREQPLRLYAYAGPTAVVVLNYKREISPGERIMQNHRIEPIGDSQGSLSVGAHLGFKLEYKGFGKKHRWMRNLSFYVSPTVYSLVGTRLAGIDFTTLKLMETVNVGVQFSFGKSRL